MKSLLSVIVALFVLTGCSKSVDQQADDYVDVSYTLCGTKVKAFSQGDDGKIRVICENDSYFVVKNQDTLAYMHELNGAYCLGLGFAVFTERSNYYTFTCSNDKNFNIPK
ncbi:MULTISPECIES: membrane lipoprotein lipid attachment site-containing protein [Photobacterium]|uniref:Lipoprotein n=2 Tax=Photobacterium TaxID=657 RepID=Q6LQF9_PHOPR|nr:MULTISPECIES: membrane lipoprotein lipid attachment site-containing protein [Photobacterium]PSV48135.1 hypothetical protein C9J47_06200 [Photobacterium indicum]CAG20467.1 conserved hypothetical protein [Photobacterium profundum SS9]